MQHPPHSKIIKSQILDLLNRWFFINSRFVIFIIWSWWLVHFLLPQALWRLVLLIAETAGPLPLVPIGKRTYFWVHLKKNSSVNLPRYSSIFQRYSFSWWINGFSLRNYLSPYILTRHRHNKHPNSAEPTSAMLSRNPQSVANQIVWSSKKVTSSTHLFRNFG